MQTNPDSNQKEAPNETNNELLDRLHNNGVFGRSEYAKKDFWNDRFKESNGFFDWYLDWEDLRPYLEKTYPIKKESKILMVGCGNAKLSEKMYRDGYQNIVNIDISDVVIDKMREYHQSINMNMEFLVMDATAMTFPDETFDVVIDKGTLDAIMCGKISEPTQKLLKEMARVSKVGGEIFIISHGQPVHRRELFVATLGNEKYKYMFSKQQLSSLAQLINIFRSKLKDKPISHIFKDKDLLEESIREYKEQQQLSILKRLLLKKKELDEAKKKSAEENSASSSTTESTQSTVSTEQTTTSENKIPSNEIENKAQNNSESNIIEKKNENEDKAQSSNVESEKVPEKEVDKVQSKTSENQEIQEEISTTQATETSEVKEPNQEEPSNQEEVKENKEEGQAEKKEDEENKEKSSTAENNNQEKDIKAEYNPQRQSYCFIFYIKKLST